MRRSVLAKQLVDTPSEVGRKALLARFRHLADVQLADELRKACYSAWTGDPVRAQRAAAVMRSLARVNNEAEINAAAFWVDGISNITKGRFGPAVTSLENAVEALSATGRRTDAAQVQVAMLLALAMQGRYDEAMCTGRDALKVFIADRDDLAAGKIEMNLSNIVSRQGKYRDAEKYGLSALRRFEKAGEKTWQAMAENSLANTYTDLNDLAKADKFYRHALATARSQKMPVTEAEIEASLGNLATFRGRYAEALRFLESSRQRYDQLAMPHQSAIADLEIGDIYSEIGLLAEAVEIYARVSAAFRRLKLRAEEARARLNLGRAAAKLGQDRTAKAELDHALELFNAEKNMPAQAAALLAQAELALARQRNDDALKKLRKAADIVARGENPRQQVQLALLEGQTLAAEGRGVQAVEKLLLAANAAKKREQPAALQSALHSLGRVSVAGGHKAKARSYFENSIGVIEDMRSPIAAGEFGIAFFGSRLGPYEDLAKLLLSDGRVADAFAVIERGRSRALLDALGADESGKGGPAKLTQRTTELRAELNFRYKALERSPDDIVRLRREIAGNEAELTKVNRRIASLAAGRGTSHARRSHFDLATIQAALGKERTLIEFVAFDGRISAFVIDTKSVRYIDGLGTTDELTQWLEDLHFQFGALRYGGAALSRFADQLKQRADETLIHLYDQLLRPMFGKIDTKKLVIVPVGPLHYVPFQALHDGEGYLVERFEITTAPSASIWRELERKRGGNIRSSLLIGYADERIPLAEREIRTLRKTVPAPSTFTGKRATFDTFTREAPRHDLIHLACHGQFRPDNPMFSSLHLADGWITVQDLTSQRLRAKLVTLSACETGLSKVFAGDELLGLARGFLAAGAASLVVSLWTVNDEAAAGLMKRFYVSLQRGLTVAASLRDAQSQLIAEGAHPYLWAPFVAIGR